MSPFGPSQLCTMSSRGWLSQPVKGLIVDISGVLKDGDIPIPGSVEGIKKLQAAGIPFRLVTNETLKPRKWINQVLSMLGYNIEENHMFHPVPALIQVLKKENLRPHLFLHPRMIPEFSELETSNPNCVVIGDCQEYFTYENMNKCFRLLMSLEKPILFTLGVGKYYLDDDGLSLDVGPYCKGLEYATGVTARIVGKPSPEYFLAAIEDLGLQPSEVVMVGDDINFDIGGAQKCGIRGALVRTGKFRKEDESHPQIKPDVIVDNFLQCVDMILEAK